MIDTSLNFLTNTLNSYLKIKNNTPNEDKVVLSSIATESGIAIPDKTLGLSLINIEEDRIYKEHKSAFINESGNTEYYNPEIKLNLYVLISANYQDKKISDPTDDYKEGLKQLSYVISFFQMKNVFTNENSPSLASIDPAIKQLTVELYSYSFEQLYNFWSVVGSKYLPSVLYKIKMLTFQAKEISAELPGVGGTGFSGTVN